MSKRCRHPTMTAIIRDKKDRVLSIGKNSYIKTHPLMLKYAQRIGHFNCKETKIHAEIDAIAKCVELDRAHTIEIYRYSNYSQRYLMSKPCKICHSGILCTPIKYVKYFNENSELVVEEVNRKKK